MCKALKIVVVGLCYSMPPVIYFVEAIALPYIATGLCNNMVYVMIVIRLLEPLHPMTSENVMQDPRC